MSIRAKENSKASLFHCVDLDYQGQRYTFQYFNQHAEEAECVIHTMIPYLEHFSPDAIAQGKDTYFDDDAIERLGITDMMKKETLSSTNCPK